MLAVELQVEAPQRLAGPVHDLLDGKVSAALLDDDRLRGVEEALNALSCPQFCGLDGPLDGALLPGRLFAWARHERLRRLPRGENMVGLYRRTPWHRFARPPHGRRAGDCNFLMARIVFSCTGVWKRNRKSRI